MVSKKFSFRPVGGSNSAGKAIIFASSTSQGFCVAVDVLVAVTNILNLYQLNCAETRKFSFSRRRSLWKERVIAWQFWMRCVPENLLTKKIFEEHEVYTALSKYRESSLGNEIVQTFRPQHHRRAVFLISALSLYDWRKDFSLTMPIVAFLIYCCQLTAQLQKAIFIAQNLLPIYLK